MTGLSEDERFARLPKWVQRGVKNLEWRNESVEERVAEANARAERARLETGPGTSRVVLADWHTGDVGLGDDARVRFHLNRDTGLRGAYVDVSLTRDGLQLQGSRSLQILLHSSNLTTIQEQPW